MTCRALPFHVLHVVNVNDRGLYDLFFNVILLCYGAIPALWSEGGREGTMHING